MVGMPGAAFIDIPAMTRAAPQERGARVLQTPAKGQHPQLTLTTLDGQTFDLAAQRGKWVIVNYWATWCPPCIKSMTVLSAFAASHPGVVVVGPTAMEKRRRSVDDFAASHAVVYPLAWPGDASIPPEFGQLDAIPVTYVISPDGTLVKSMVAQFDDVQLAALMRAAGYVQKL